MKGSWTALAVALVGILAVAGCNDYGNTFQGNTGAVITSLSPSNVNAGGPDLTITVNGGGFTPTKHFGFEAAAWYWHFVDVVWLFLFTFVYFTFGSGWGH